MKNLIMIFGLIAAIFCTPVQKAQADWPSGTPANIIELRDAYLSMKAQAEFFRDEYESTRTVLDIKINGVPTNGTYDWRINGDLYLLLGLCQSHVIAATYDQYNAEIADIMDLSANAGFEASDGADKRTSGIVNYLSAVDAATTGVNGSATWEEVEALLLAAIQDMTDARTKYTLANTIAENGVSRAHEIRYTMLGVIP